MTEAEQGSHSELGLPANAKSPIPEMVEYTHTPVASPPAVRWQEKLRYGILRLL